MTFKALGMLHSMLLKDVTTTGVPYMSEDQRARYKIQIAHGLLFMASGAGLNTSRGLNPKGKFLFVMDVDGTIFAGPNQDVHHHSSFLSGRPIASAGLIGADNGKVTYLDPQSGHYSPPKDYFDQVVTKLRSEKVPLDDCEISYPFKATSKQIAKFLKGRKGKVVTDAATGVKDQAGNPVASGQHVEGQRLRLYPGEMPKWQWF